jgi:hypothetical protein
MNDQQRKQWIFDRMKHSLQALSLPASTQNSLFPEFVVRADELVLDFDHWRVCAVGNYRAEMTDAQLDSLAAIDAYQRTSGALRSNLRIQWHPSSPLSLRWSQS